MDELNRMFSYAFGTGVQNGGGVPVVLSNIVTPLHEFVADGERIMPLPVFHGSREILGYRIGDFAYITDVSNIPERPSIN